MSFKLGLYTILWICAMSITLIAQSIDPSEDCPTETVEIRRESPPNGALKIYCKRISELSPVEIAMLSPAIIANRSASDRLAIERRSRGIRNLPIIDPQSYATSDWLTFARAQERRLIKRRIYLTRSVSQLQDQTFRNLIKQHDGLVLDLLEDTIANTIETIGAITKVIGDTSGIPPEISKQIEINIETALARLNSTAALRAEDQGRKAEKTIEVSNSIKNLLLANPRIPLSPSQRDALVRGTNALSSLAKATQRWADGGQLDVMEISRSADNFVEALSNLPRLDALKGLRLSVHLTIAVFAMAIIQQNTRMLANGFQSHILGKEFINERISQTDEWIAEYRRFLPSRSP